MAHQQKTIAHQPPNPLNIKYKKCCTSTTKTNTNQQQNHQTSTTKPLHINHKTITHQPQNHYTSTPLTIKHQI